MSINYCFTTKRVRRFQRFLYLLLSGSNLFQTRWEYNPEELVRFTPLRRFSSSANTSAVWSHFKVHTSMEYADKAWCDYCHRPFSREHSTLSRHIERHHKEKMKNAQGLSSYVPNKRDHFNGQEIAARAVFHNANPFFNKS